MHVFYGPSIEIARLNALHDFLRERGWELGPYSHEDEDGYPGDPESSWCYPDSFGGVEMNEVGDATPCQLSCRFSFEEGEPAFLVESAGNEKGCERHAATTVLIEAGEGEWGQLATLLDQLEQQARDLDPRELIECLFFGDCGRAEA